MKEKSNGLKAIRKKRGYTQEDMAKLCNVRICSYRYWEAGVKYPTLEHRQRLEEVLNISTAGMFRKPR